ncbi:hypothetical protein AGMMS50267_09560 [Spirochaetia bacterium]|nr:hypothetical protein AGMMS50267_09560 [Spirochaetia bacterium]
MKTTKNWSKAFGRKTMPLAGMAAIATLVAMLAFGLVLVGCSTDDDDSGGAYDGTYTNANGSQELVISGSNFTVSMKLDGTNLVVVAKGTFVVSGENVTTTTITHMMDDSGILKELNPAQIGISTISADGKTITYDGTAYTKQ